MILQGNGAHMQFLAISVGVPAILVARVLVYFAQRAATGSSHGTSFVTGRGT